AIEQPELRGAQAGRAEPNALIVGRFRAAVRQPTSRPLVRFPAGQVVVATEAAESDSQVRVLARPLRDLERHRRPARSVEFLEREIGRIEEDRGLRAAIVRVQTTAPIAVYDPHAREPARERMQPRGCAVSSGMDAHARAAQERDLTEA